MVYKEFANFSTQAISQKIPYHLKEKQLCGIIIISFSKGGIP